MEKLKITSREFYMQRRFLNEYWCQKCLRRLSDSLKHTKIFWWTEQKTDGFRRYKVCIVCNLFIYTAYGMI